MIVKDWNDGKLKYYSLPPDGKFNYPVENEVEMK
jgi:hypothetical protein